MRPPKRMSCDEESAALLLILKNARFGEAI